MLRVDIAALQRISKYLRVKEQREWASSTGTNQSRERSFSIVSLVKALTDECGTNTITTFGTRSSKSKSKFNAGLATTLQMLEQATMMEYGSKTANGTSGSWLLNAAGNGDEFRELQQSSSEQWSLVTAFCRGHELPLSTTFLVTLARDNDWVRSNVFQGLHNCIPLLSVISCFCEDLVIIIEALMCLCVLNTGVYIRTYMQTYTFILNVSMCALYTYVSTYIHTI